MLDFYIISDSERKPKSEELGKLNYAGGIEIEMFDRLKRKGVIDLRFEFYSDFRWSNQLIKQIESKAKEFNLDTDIDIFKKIIKKAIEAESGLIAIAD